MDKRVAVVALGTVVLAGCAGTDATTAAARCEASWQAAADETDTDRAHDQLHLGFRSCTSYEQWLGVSEAFPAEVLEGYSPEEFVEVGCQESDLADSPVCLSRR